MKTKPSPPLRRAAFLLGLIILPASLFGQDEPTAFLVATRAVEEIAEPEFRKLIDSYMKFDLEQRRLVVLTEADVRGAEQGLDWPSGEVSPEELQKPALRIGRKAKADFVILCSYRRIGPEVELRFDLYDLAEDSLALSDSARRSLTLLLDWRITDLIEHILEAIGPRLVYLASVPEAQALPAETPVVAQIPLPRVEPLPPPSFQPVEPVVHPLEISLRLSPLFAVGEAANYFRLGFFPSVGGSYRLYTPAGHLSLGASLGLLMFSAESPSITAQGYLIPMAASVGFLRPFPGSRLTFQVRLASGPALFVLAPQSSSPQAKILAYLGAGIGAELALSPAWGVRLELDYSIFFENVQPIMGYSPVLCGFYRF
jgi:hypothetical protein